MGTIFLMVVAIFGVLLMLAYEKAKSERTDNKLPRRRKNLFDTPRPEKPFYETKNEPRNAEQQDKPLYRDKFKLLNEGEKQLYDLLTAGMPNFIVLCQVSMSQIFHLKDKDKYRQIGEIGRKSVDFLICRRNFSIVGAVELNSHYHDTERQQLSDNTKKRALEEAGIPLLIYRQGELPTIETLRKDMAHAIVKRREYEERRDQRLQRKPFVS